MIGVNDIPLLPFFLKWRRHEESYGRMTSDPEALLLLLEELARGRGLFSADDLLMLCKTVLLKPGHNEQDFDRLFHQYLLSIQPKPPKSPDQPGTDPGAPTEQQTDKTKQTKEQDPATDQGRDKRSTESSEPPPQATTITAEQEMISIYFADDPSGAEGLQMEMHSSKDDIAEQIFQKKAFIIQGDDYLLPDRVVQQAWRSMRTLQEVGPKRILDIDKTVDQVAHSGFLGQPVYRARAENTASLMLLIDASPSMIAFSGLAQKMIKTAGQDRHFRDLEVFYFDNVPEDYLYRDAQLFEPLDIADFLEIPRRSVLIFSDAGAARGRKNWDRVAATLSFLHLINAPHLAWVNPMPRQRWEGTSALALAGEIDCMFASDPLEFRNAIKQLRGKLKTGGA